MEQYTKLSEIFDDYYNKYQNWCRENIDPYLNFAYNYVWITFLNWINVTCIENSGTSSIKWIVYTHLGQKYRIPVKRPRGPIEPIDAPFRSKVDPKIYNEMVGPFGDFHGQIDLIKQLFPL